MARGKNEIAARAAYEAAISERDRLGGVRALAKRAYEQACADWDDANQEAQRAKERILTAIADDERTA